MVVAAKTLWSYLNPDAVLLLALALAVLLLWTPWRRLGRWLATGVALAMLLIGVLPLGDWIIWPLEDSFPPPGELPPRIDGVIVLGGNIRSAHPPPGKPGDLANVSQRLHAFAELARHYPEARLVFTGGAPPHIPNAWSEVDEARPIFVNMGLDLSRVTFEPTARNTMENARASKALVGPKAGERWLLVTSAMHMPRAVGVFRAEGWAVIPYPVDITPPAARERHGFGVSFANGVRELTRGSHEWLGLLLYRLLGHTQEFFPA
jgi:uncharacterized SAM-binding protein YcdF (DUF218 family)